MNAMQAHRRARFAALTLLTVASAFAAAALFVLVSDGGCLHALLGLHRDGAMAAMPGMAGMQMPAAGATAGPCPILFTLAAAVASVALGAFALAARPVLRRLVASLARRLVPAAPRAVAVRAVAPQARFAVCTMHARGLRAPPR